MTLTPSAEVSTTLAEKLQIMEVKPGLKFSVGALRELLPDVETALFFGKVYDLNYSQLSLLLSTVLRSDLAAELFTGDHSVELQDYVVDMLDFVPSLNAGNIEFSTEPVPQGEILPELWKSLEVEVATSIKQVAARLESVVHHMPGKEGQMMFQAMRVMNAKRPILGDYKARIHHAPQKQNLVILDVSSSMSRRTVEKIVDDVVSMSYMANAHLAIVSNTATHWQPGTFGSADVLREGEFSGTHYEQLLDLMAEDWGVVVTVADYDSSVAAKNVLAGATGSIDEVLDISLVNRPTYLAECVGQIAAQVRPLLVANTYQVLND